ncbi:hypothetical protein FRC01_005171 [Tulasnella sp. 417]|nr:hypothetical protein FRC01_005171 [Tulasnella sp. 417]
MLEVSKETLLDILGSMGVELPSDTTMTTDMLQERLERAIDAAQFIRAITPSNKKKNEIDIGVLPTWSASDDRVQFAVDRTSWQDTFNGLKSLFKGVRDLFDYSAPEGRDAFVSWRYLLNLLGEAYDAGRPGIILVDGETQSAVLIKIHEIRAVNARTPLVVVHFRHAMASTGKGFDFGPYQRPRADIQAHFFVRPAQYLVLRVLEANGKRIPASYAPVDPGLKLSFLLPVGTIVASETGKLAKNNTKDWKAHKRSCRTLDGAAWETFPIDMSGPFSDMPSYPTKFSNRDPIGGVPGSKTTQYGRNPAKVPPMKKASAEPFLLKIQDNNSPWLMIYDRSRELDAFFKREENDLTGKWVELKNLMETKGIKVGLNMKIYCWAKRIGERELSVALDRVPDQDVPW